MQKLTSEQAEWLIEKLKDIEKMRPCKDGAAGLAEVFMFPSEVYLTINQCTEKAFPEFKIHGSAHNMDVIEVSKDMGEGNEDSEENIFINIENGAWDEKSFIMLDHNEFKTFTAGCVAICDWLKEQE